MSVPNLCKFWPQVCQRLSIAPDAYRTFVETGSQFGKTALMALHLFDRVISYEWDESRYRALLTHFGDTDVHWILGSMPENPPIFSGPAVWFLDAHPDPSMGDDAADYPPLPLFDELRHIRSRNNCDIIIVDDRHCFGRQDGVWDNVTSPAILETLHDGVIEATPVGDALVLKLETLP